MKAIVINRHGGPEVLEPATLPDPQPAPGEVLVRVRACALNRLDIWTRQGLPGRSIPPIDSMRSSAVGKSRSGSPARNTTRRRHAPSSKEGSM